MRSRKLVLFMASILVIIAGLGSGAYIYMFTKIKDFEDIFRSGIYVEETYIGGLTREKAKEEVSKMVETKKESKNITIYGNDTEIVIPYNKFKGKYNIDEILDQAFIIGHEGTIIQRFRDFTSKEAPKVTFTLIRSYDEKVAQEIVKEYAESFYIAPIDATMTRENKKFIITPEKPGQELDIESTAKKINDIYNSGEDGKVEAVIKVVDAKKTSSYFDNVQTPISSFYTTYGNSDPDRNINLAVGADKINTSIEPGEVFALSDYFGIVSADQGFKNSKVISNGELVDGIGGGICQVASTLYNSVLLTDLKIVSRQNHSLPVGYLPLGRDATYASGSIDFKFENPTQYPAYVESYVEKNKLYVNIYGHESLKPDHDIKFESVVTEVVSPPAPKYQNDSSLEKGKQVQQVSAREGKKVSLYKYIYKDGKLVDKVLENTSYYRPRAAVIRVGTKAVAQPQPTPEIEAEQSKQPEIVVEGKGLEDGEI